MHVMSELIFSDGSCLRLQLDCGHWGFDTSSRIWSCWCTSQFHHNSRPGFHEV